MSTDVEQLAADDAADRHLQNEQDLAADRDAEEHHGVRRQLTASEHRRRTAERRASFPDTTPVRLDIELDVGTVAALFSNAAANAVGYRSDYSDAVRRGLDQLRQALAAAGREDLL